jgi:hypothetical protein
MGVLLTWELEFWSVLFIFSIYYHTNPEKTAMTIISLRVIQTLGGCLWHVRKSLPREVRFGVRG